MRKIMLFLIIFVSLLSIVFFLINQYEDNMKEEKVYTVKTSYAYLSNGETNLDICIYTNKEDSLIKYATEAISTLHDKDNTTIVDVIVADVFLVSSTTYFDEYFYEYSINLKLEISKLKIDECYLTLKFTNKAYTFNIGSVEIEENLYEDNVLKITDLYGVSSVNDISLAAIIISFNNTNSEAYEITNVSIGNYHTVLLDNLNSVKVSESIYIEDYSKTEKASEGYLTVNSDSVMTFILPIEYNTECYLYNCYLLIECNGIKYYISNFNYINSNDLEALGKYLIKGMIYEI